MANALWLDSTHAEFRKDYTEKVENAFSASLRSTKFQDGAKASREVNQWVSEKTHGKIKEVVGPDDFKSRSGPDRGQRAGAGERQRRLLQGGLGQPVRQGSDSDGPFHVNAATTENTPMMHQQSVLPYAANEEFQFLEIPYIDGQYSMYVLLPRKILGVKDLMSHVTARTVMDLKRNSAVATVDVLLPKFEFKGHYGIKDQLGKMGVSSAFDEGKADFDKMIVKKMDAYRIYVSEIYHNAWIEVHEEGTRAAAATTTVHYSIGCSGGPPNRPARRVPRRSSVLVCDRVTTRATAFSSPAGLRTRRGLLGTRTEDNRSSKSLRNVCGRARRFP